MDRVMFSAIFSALLISCGPGDAPQREASAADRFCRDALAAVDDALRGQGSGGAPGRRSTAVVTAASELQGGMGVFGPQDFIALQHQQFVHQMTLLRLDEDLRAEPWLARSWTLADDSTTLTFHLRDDVLWHDGETTDAHDVAFTFRRITDPQTGYPDPTSWSPYVAGDEGVEVVDSFTVRFRLAEPRGELLYPWRALAIMPEHLLGDVPPADLATHPYGSRCPVGSGPFVFEAREPGGTWTFRSNPSFPEALGGPPAVGRYVYRPVPESTTRLTSLLTGGSHVYLAMPPDHADRIASSETARVLSYMDRSYVFIAWNARVDKLADPRVRRALTMALDRQAMIDALLGGRGRVAHTGVPPFHPAFDPELEGLSWDTARARKLLGDAGWRDRDGDGVLEDASGRPFTLSLQYHSGVPLRADVAQLAQAQLADVGVDVELEVVELSTLVDRVTSPERQFEGVVFGWSVDFHLDDTPLFHSRHVDDLYALSGTQNPRIDALLDSLGTVQATTPTGQAMWKRYQRALVEEQPYTFIYFRERANGVATGLRNVEMDIRGDLVNVAEWRLEDPEATDRQE